MILLFPKVVIVSIFLLCQVSSSFFFTSPATASRIFGVSPWATKICRIHHPVHFSHTSTSCGRPRSSKNAYLDTNSGDGGGNDSNIESLLLTRMASSTSELKILLERMSLYFGSMVDPETNRFFLLSNPQCHCQSQSQFSTATCYSHQHCPLRDLGSSWDATTAVQILSYHQDTLEPAGTAITALKDAVLQTVEYYSSSFAFVDGNTMEGKGISLSSEIVNEPPNIAHNGLLLLALVEAERLRLFGDGITSSSSSTSAAATMDGLARGILSMQRSDGAFRTYYTSQDDNDDDVYRDIEFFSGEAMTALVESFSHSSKQNIKDANSSAAVSDETRNQILPAMIRALEFYRGFYAEGRRNSTIDTNYAIWQVQAFGRLSLILRRLAFEDGNGGKALSPPTDGNADLTATATTAEIISDEAADYCLDMCKDIVRSPSWRMISCGKSFYPNLSTVEIACGLDALVQGGIVAAQRCHHHGESENSENGDIENRESEDCLLLFTRHIDHAIDFLTWSQDRVPSDSKVGYGGLGYGGLQVMEQRLDITGHALSALSKLVLHKK
mmetsp:Transcript_5188/g.9982  ORF Transcript_5188/g.9982 Transcript_5188/m.9982 type:complete len:556 (-) Transcript_5188:48-1715(-)